MQALLATYAIIHVCGVV